MSYQTDEIILLDDSDLEEVLPLEDHPLDEWKRDHGVEDFASCFDNSDWDDDSLVVRRFGWLDSARERVRAATRRALFRMGWLSYYDADALLD